LNWIAPPAVIELESWVVPEPAVSPPDREPVAAEEKVSWPELVTVRGPLAAVVKVLFTLNAVPVRTIPVAPVVLSVPLNVVVPEPDVCWINAEAIFCVETFATVLIVKPVSGVPIVPTFPLKVIDPVPSLRVKACAPVMAVATVISPPPADPVSSVASPPRATPPDPFKAIAVSVVVMVPLREKLPELKPLSVKPFAAEILAFIV